MDIMIDIETVATGPAACILTIAAQCFDPLTVDNIWSDKFFYARIDIDSQPNRTIEESTISWWATQPKEIQNEAFSVDDRVPLDQALEGLGKLIWHSKHVWANGPTFDMTILEHAYKSYNKALPWQYYNVRDARTVYSLYPELPKPPVSHHALEDCRRQIIMLQNCLTYLGIKNLR